MVKKVLDFIGGLLVNWYVILSSIAVAFLAAVLDNFILTDWLYPLGIYASYVFLVCVVYLVVRVLIEALIGWVKKW